MRGSARHHGLAPQANDSELGLQCGVISLSGANPHSVVDIRDENLAVTDLTRGCRPHDRVDDLVDETAGNHDFNLDLWNKAYRIFGAMINFGRLFLMAETHDLGHVYARNANLPQRLPNFFEFEWLDDGDDAFHGIAPGFGGLGFAPRASEHCQNTKHVDQECATASSSLSKEGKSLRLRIGFVASSAATTAEIPISR